MVAQFADGRPRGYAAVVRADAESGGALDREMGFFAQRLGAEFIADELVADRQRLHLVVAEAERLAAIGAALRKRPDRTSTAFPSPR